jgi:hypothetical protein
MKTLDPRFPFDPEHPQAVVDDADLTLNEKRAILAAWASDACAVEASPALRVVPGTGHRVGDILQALRQLDKQANALADGVRRATRRRPAGAARPRHHPGH